MKTLKNFIKQEIKHESFIRKQTNLLNRQLRSLWDRNLRDSNEYREKNIIYYDLYKKLRFPFEPRYIYLAYAKVREKDWTLLEKYPEKVSLQKIEDAIKYLSSNFEKSQKIIEEVRHE